VFCVRVAPVRFGLGVTAILLASLARPSEFGAVVDIERSFFGVHRVYNDSANNLRLLFHGGTMHGVQSLDPLRARVPLAYYGREGPIGQVFEDSAAAAGLGGGRGPWCRSAGGYAREGQAWTFFEIDPVVVSLARDAGYFTYLKDAPTRTDVVVGDARTSMAKLDRKYDLIVLDAFSSDAVPVAPADTRGDRPLPVRACSPVVCSLSTYRIDSCACASCFVALRGKRNSCTSGRSTRTASRQEGGAAACLRTGSCSRVPVTISPR